MKNDRKKPKRNRHTNIFPKEKIKTKRMTRDRTISIVLVYFYVFLEAFLFKYINIIKNHTTHFNSNIESISLYDETNFQYQNGIFVF